VGTPSKGHFCIALDTASADCRRCSATIFDFLYEIEVILVHGTHISGCQLVPLRLSMINEQ
jgi:hypothetical protein